MELHGENPLQNAIAIIPARYRSVRLPGKMLLEIDGVPLIVHTLRRALAAENVSRVIVATDDARILNVIRENGGEAVMTSANHRSGSDRIAEVAKELPLNSIIVNVQGDEPLISPQTIESAVAARLEDDSADIVTTCEPIENPGDLMDPNVVKVVTDKRGYALYFSRSPIPYPREASLQYQSLAGAYANEQGILAHYRKHTGLYVYSREYLLDYASMPQTELEGLEMLEQLRALENGARIKVVEAEASSIGVDTPEDFERVKRIIENNG